MVFVVVMGFFFLVLGLLVAPWVLWLSDQMSQ